MEQSFKKLSELSKKLREECPWDRRQTVQSYYRYVLDEAKEFDDAARKGDAEGMKDELGDVLWNILFVADMAEKEGLFKLKDVLEHSHEKMVRRHPHIFNNESKEIADIRKRWEEIKEEEKKRKAAR